MNAETYLFDRMDSHTIGYYQENAASLTEHYESADMSDIHTQLLKHLPEKGSILEIGCGSGREAAFLLRSGFDITAVDASAKMLSCAVRQHPELEGRTHCFVFPFRHENPLLSKQFDGVIVIASLMHIPDQYLPECASQFRHLLSANGVLFVSASRGRQNITDRRDSDGRLFIERSPDELRHLFRKAGFGVIDFYENEDSLHRLVQWFSIVLRVEKGMVSDNDRLANTESSGAAEVSYEYTETSV
jgi:SAM-dependent methyltransferase